MFSREYICLVLLPLLWQSAKEELINRRVSGKGTDMYNPANSLAHDVTKIFCKYGWLLVYALPIALLGLYSRAHAVSPGRRFQ